MRALLRLLVPLLGLALATGGVLLVIEVVAAWVRTPATTGLLVPWPDWRSAGETLTWADPPVPGTAAGVAAAGLLLVLVGLLARRHDVALTPPSPDLTVTTSPGVLARLVGRRVRTTPGVAAASVTATRRRVTVGVQAGNDAGADLHDEVTAAVGALLDELPLDRRPGVSVTVQPRRGPR